MWIQALEEIVFIFSEFDVINIGQIVLQDIVVPYVTPIDNAWRISCLKELINLTDGYASIVFTKRELMDTIDYVFTS